MTLFPALRSAVLLSTATLLLGGCQSFGPNAGGYPASDPYAYPSPPPGGYPDDNGYAPGDYAANGYDGQPPIAPEGGQSYGMQSLAGTSWRILSVNGLPVESREAGLDFDGQTVSGSTGCNRFSADYTLEGMAISFGPVRSTRMACDARIMGQERALLDLLNAAEAQPVGNQFRRLGAVRYAPNGNMILSTPDGRVAVLARAL